MGQAPPAPTLQHLRQTLAALDPSLAPRLADEEHCVNLGAPINAVLGGGLPCGALHELAPAAPIYLGAASGFAIALAALAAGRRGEVLWIATDLAAGEGGNPYGPGLDLFGLPAARLLVLRVPRPVDVLWAMEEALRCRGLACVVAELTGHGAEADLTATRRLVLAARDGGSGSSGGGFGLLIRHRATVVPSAAATRWQIAAAPSEPDAYGGLGRTRFDLTLSKNRRGPSGRWIIEWNHHEHVFQSAISFGVAAPPLDRPDRAPLVRTG
jgi:protein ImuA